LIRHRYDALVMSGIPGVGTGEAGTGGSPSGPRRPTRALRGGRLEQRVAVAAQAALAARGFVTPIDVLVGVGWLQAAQVERWRRGQVAYLERVATANLTKLGTALRLLRRWAQLNQLTASETVYVAWTRDRHRLRFSASGDDNVERAYRTHWISARLREAKQRHGGDRRSHGAQPGSAPR
jgi:hypothetical protein